MTSRPPFVILSGRYCTQELSAELGMLPAAFVPLGNGRLIHQQIALAEELLAEPVVTLPEDYVLNQWDTDFLDKHKARIIRTASSFDLREAIAIVLESLNATGPLYLLYGDTLVVGNRLGQLDQIAVNTTQSNYNWSEVETPANAPMKITSGYGDGVTKRRIVCGYFAFSDAASLKEAVAGSNDFDTALEIYHNAYPLAQVDVEEWYDMGHLPLYYQSRRNLMVSRAFNNLHCDGTFVTKSSNNRQKMAAEAQWYQELPPPLRVYTPHFLGHDAEAGSYKLEYLFLPTLSELYVFGELPAYTWRKIFEKCIIFLQACHEQRPTRINPASTPQYAKSFFELMLLSKTRKRVAEFVQSRGWDPDAPIIVNGVYHLSLQQTCERLLSHVRPTTPEDITLWHGDVFFGNMFYDFRAERVRVIDPRGGPSADLMSVYGDWRYDVAKLAHSVIGYYDALLAGCVKFEKHAEQQYSFILIRTDRHHEVESAFTELTLNSKPLLTHEIRAMVALLFLTMLPLHKEDETRQDVMMCNGLRLAHELFKEIEGSHT